jgi:hypothetical protein
MYLATGEQSDTHIHRIAKDAYEADMPLVVVTVSDFDPAGWQMPISIGRKLRAFQVALFPDLEYRVIPAGLTFRQCVDRNLPSTPLKATVKERAQGQPWLDAYGREQTELDAMLALHPGVIADAVSAAFAPFFDETLADRVEEARDEWFAAARERIAAAIGEPELRELRDRYATAMQDIDAINDRLQDACVGIELDEPDEVEADPPFDNGEDGGDVIASTDMSFIEESLALIERKHLAGEDDEDEDDGE